MKLHHYGVLATGGSLTATSAMFVRAAWAQGSISPLAAPRPATDGSTGGLVLALTLLGLLLVALGVAVAFYDKKQKREDEAVGWQGRISDALLVDRSLSRSTLTPEVRMPRGRDGLMTVTLSGAVPTPELREEAIDLVMRTMNNVGASFSVEDRITVDPRLATRRAA